MSKEKQIEEMAKDICRVKQNCNDVCHPINTCMALKYSRRAHEAGYRKQNEGEWKKIYDKAPRYVCTACNHLYNNKEYKYCPNCGAIMKGGE